MSEKVAHEADLARIRLSEEERRRMEKDLDHILDYISQLNEVPVEGVEPTYHVLPLANVFRDDRIEPSLPVEEALKNAPDRSGTFFRVPKIL